MMTAISRRFACGALLAALWLAPALAKEPQAPDSKQLENQLQRLDWPQFRSVVESIPKLKADVDAYGPAGWTYVKGKYKTYGWKKNIDKLDDAEKRRLAALIQAARKAR
jgi:hypothetical protein